MLGYQFSWRTSLLLIISLSALVSSSPVPDIKRRNETFNHGPYAMRLVSAHPNLTNAFFTGGVTFKENPDPKAIQPIWAGASYWKFTQPPTSSDSLYEGYGAIFLDDRLDNVNSPQLVLYYTKDSDQHVPFLYWNWEAGPGTTHLWPASWYVTWGGFRFVRQNDTGKVFLEGSGSDSRFRRAAEYNTFSDAWAMRSWNSTDPSVPLPQNWEFVNIEVIPFEELGNRNL